MARRPSVSSLFFELLLCGAVFVGFQHWLKQQQRHDALDRQATTCSEFVAAPNNSRVEFAAEWLERLRSADARTVRADLVAEFADRVRTGCPPPTRPAREVAADVYAGARDRYGAP